MHWYSGQWKLSTDKEDRLWTPPEGCFAGLDLRSIPDQSQTDVVGGVGIFCGDDSLKRNSDYEYLGFGHLADIKVSQRLKNLIPVREKYHCKGDNLGQLLFDVLSDGADPTGEEFAKPLQPDHQLQLKLTLGGCLVRSPLLQLSARHWSNIRDVIRIDNRKQFLSGGNHYRRILDATCDKYKERDKRKGWKQFVPRDLIQHIPGVLQHATIYTDDFNRASMGSDWTYDGDVQTQASWATNQASLNGNAGVYPRWVWYNPSLSSDDHYCQLYFSSAYGSNTTRWCGPAVRSSTASTRTGYISTNVRNGNHSIQKAINNSRTTLTSGTGLGGLWKTWKLQADGSSLELFADSGNTPAVTSRLSTTDTSITGSVNTGFNGHSYGGGAADQFEAADLIVEASPRYSRTKSRIFNRSRSRT